MLRQQLIEGHRTARGAELSRDDRIPQASGNAGHRSQLSPREMLGQEQQKDEIDGALVDRFELHRRPEEREHAKGPIEAAEPCVGKRHPLAEPGRSETLPLEERLDDQSRVQAEEGSRSARQLLEDPPLVGFPQFEDRLGR